MSDQLAENVHHRVRAIGLAAFPSLLFTAVLGCQGARDASPAGALAVRDEKVQRVSAALITDQASSPSSRGFYWIPPVIQTASPAFSTLDQSGLANSLAINVDRLFPDGSTAAKTSFASAAITMVTGASSGAFLGVTGPFYGANWAAGTTVAAGDVYRVSVRALSPARVLGVADVQVVVNAAAAAAVDRTRFAPLIAGNTLPIVFRLEGKDTDGDALNDWRDNCPVTRNATQLDSNGDGLGDACQCLNVANGTPCSNPCRTGQTCTGGVCGGGTVVTSGACVSGNPCKMNETCNASGVCGSTQNRTGSCATGNPCKTGETCNVGTCGGGTNRTGSCATGNPCKTGETCSAGTCGGGSNRTAGSACSTTGNACKTGETCSSGGVCGGTAANVANGTACSDGNLCTQADSCQAGVCSGASPLACLTDACHNTGACSPTTGTCPARRADGQSCSDGNVCNGAETCSAGACVTGTAPVLDDSNPCTADSCNATTGVTHAPVANGTSCSDANPCNGSETCQTGACTAGTPLAINDSNPCTADACSASGAITHTAVADGTSCDDGNRCTTGDACRAGVCQPGAATACNTSTFFAPIVDLGTVGGTATEATAIDATGDVVGIDYDVWHGSGASRAFRYTPSRAPGAIAAAGSAAAAYGINNAGLVAGTAGGAGFLSTAAGGFTPYPDTVSARGINDAGQFTGAFLSPGGATQAYRYAQSTNIRLALPTLTGPIFSGNMEGRAVDAGGRVAGVAFTLTTPQPFDIGRAFVYSDAGGMKDLNTLLPAGSGWTLSVASAANGTRIAGYGFHNGSLRGFRYSSAAAGSIDEMGILPAFPARNLSMAEGINTAGEVVGHVFSGSGGDDRAWIYTTDGQLRDLNELVDPASGWTLQVARAINDNRQVVGWGTHNGVVRAFEINVPDLTACPPQDACRGPATRNLATGLCASAPVMDGVACDDGNRCTVGDACHAGTCLPGASTVCTAPGQTPYLSAINIGAMQGFSWARDINNNGVVVGADLSWSAIGPGPGLTGGIHWTEAEGMTYLPTLGLDNFPMAVNDDGIVAGIAGANASGWFNAYRYDARTDAQLRVLVQGPALAINRAGLVTGYGYFPELLSLYRIGATTRELFPLSPQPTYTGLDVGQGIADDGSIVGWTQLAATGAQVALRYTDAQGVQILDDVIPAGSGWKLSVANATNGRAIVGWGKHNGLGRAYRIDTADASGHPTITDLGMIASQSPTTVNVAVAADVNAFGDIVGGVYDSIPFWPSQAFIYLEGLGMLDLNTFLDPQSGWQLNVAYAINDKRDIVGLGTFHGAHRAFKMTLPQRVVVPGAVSPITLRVDGVVDTGDGKLVAVFGFDNSDSATAHPAVSRVYLNGRKLPDFQPQPPQQLAPGSHPGAFLPAFASDEAVSWKVDGQMVTASATTPRLPKVPIGSSGYGVSVGGTVITIKPDLDAYRAIPPDPQAADDRAVGDPYQGSLTGALSVGPTGASIYTLPIAIPPGVAGMAPNLSLVYNSQAGVGIAGQSWDLTGLSVIYRCPKTRLQDGYARPVVMDPLVKSDGDDTDGICLDGQRLFEDPIGSGKYRGERKDFTSVERDPTSTFFTLKTKAGETRLYGSQSHSRVVVPRGTLEPTVPPTGTETAIWALDRVSDVWGNFYDLEYNGRLGDVLTTGLRVTQINYTGHLAANGSTVDVNPFYQIVFEYEGQPNTRVVGVGPLKLPRNQRLKRIFTPRGKYTLDYLPDSLFMASRMNQITYCASSGTCLAPLTFDWDWRDYGWTEAPAYALKASIDPYDSAGKDVPPSGAQLVDLDGDGLLDFILSKEGVTPSECGGVWRNTGSGWACAPPTWGSLPAKLVKADGRINGRLADINGDGLPDLVFSSVDNVCTPGAGCKFGPFSPAVWINQTNHGGDWTFDDARSTKPAGWVGVDFATSTTLADMNGDGRADLVFLDPSEPNDQLVLLNTPSGWQKPNQGSFQQLDDSGGVIGGGQSSEYFLQAIDLTSLHLADINRDGLPDLVPNKASSIGGGLFGWIARINAASVAQGGVESFSTVGSDADGTLGTTTKTQTVWKKSFFLTDPGANAAPKDRYEGDLDGDGLRDVVTYSPHSQCVLLDPPGECGPEPDLCSALPCTDVLVGLDAKVAFSTGAGYTTDGTANLLAMLTFDKSAILSRSEDERVMSLVKHRVALADINGDGLVDLVKENGHQLLMNVGGDWQTAVGSAPVPTVPTREFQYQDANGGAFVDLDGDGIVDLVQSSSASGSLVSRAWLNTFRPPVIAHFPNGLATKTVLTYSVITTADAHSRGVYTSIGGTGAVNSLAMPMRVVDSMTTDAATSLGATTRRTYAYSGLGTDPDRGPQGFHTMTVTEPAGSTTAPSTMTTTTTFAQRYPYTGLPLSVARNNQGPLTTTDNRYCDTLAEVNGVLQCSAGGSYPPRTSLFVYPWRVADTTFLRVTGASLPETGARSAVTTVFRYDDQGNPTLVDVTASSPLGAVAKQTKNTYGLAGSAEQLAGKTTRTEIIATDPQHPERTTHHVTEFDYLPTPRGGLALSKTRIEPGALAAGPGPGAPPGDQLETHTAYGYDAFGNVTTTTECASAFDQCGKHDELGSADLPFRITRISFDPISFVVPAGNVPVQNLGYGPGRFPVKTVNAAGHVEYTAYNELFGTLKQRTGPNGVTTCYELDDFGSQTKQTARCGSATPLVTTANRFLTTAADFAWAKVVLVTRDPTGAGAWTYADALGRTVDVFQRAFGGGYVETVKGYDAFGLVAGSHDQAGFTTFSEYDYLGRVTRVSRELGQIDGTVHDALSDVRTSYQGTQTVTTETRATGTRSRSEVKGPLGKALSVTDAGGLQMTFDYDPDGNLIDTHDPAGNDVHVEYDRRGRKTLMRDPDMGQWTYGYDGFGEITNQTDAKGQAVAMTYDTLGRMVMRTDADGTAQWVYDQGTGGLGKLAAMVSAPDPRLKSPCAIPFVTLTDGNRAGRSFTYTPFGDVADATDCTDGDSFTTSHGYDDATGHESVTTYPAVKGVRMAVAYHYTNLGFLHYVTDVADGGIIWRAKTVNALGQVIDEYTRNGVETVSNNNPGTGWLLGRTATSHGDADRLIQSWTFSFDEVGNLLTRSRNDQIAGAAANETFIYDRLDRVTNASVAGQGYSASETYSYDSLGNLSTKGSDTNKYTYGTCGAGPHAVCQVTGGVPFIYDANGNVTQENGRTIGYNAGNRSVHIASTAGGAATVDLIYGADGNRVVEETASSAGTERTVYVGLGGTGRSLYERTTRASSIEHTMFLYAGGAHGGAPFALRTVIDDGSASPPTAARYYHTDHLGSVTAVSDDNGHVVDAATGGGAAGVMGYDAWGARRSPDGRAADPASFALPAGRRGFTGHEAIPGVGLVNMNGRVYDPVLGRFLSPDPTVQFASDLQSYNRYSYVLNNPLRYTDPTGYSIGSTLANIGVGLLAVTLGAVCTASGGSGCILIGFMFALYNAGAMLAQGVPFDQVAPVTILGLVAGQMGAGVGGAVAGELGGKLAAQLVGGAVAGAVTAAYTTPITGGNLGRNILMGAAQGAAGAAVSWVATQLSTVSVADTDEAKGGGGSGAILVERKVAAYSASGLDNPAEGMPVSFGEDDGTFRDQLSICLKSALCRAALASATTVDVSTAWGKSVFYSGAGAEKAAIEYAARTGAMTVQMTLESTPDGKALFDLLESSALSRPEKLALWTVLSVRYALGASGPVAAFVSWRGTDESSIYFRYELPVLKSLQTFGVLTVIPMNVLPNPEVRGPNERF